VGALVITISSEGKKLDPLAQILSVEVTREVNRVPKAEVRLIDGSVPDRKFELSDTALFEPGKKVTIAAREGDAPDATLFEGLVVRHGVESRPGGSFLRVELKDAAFKLTRKRRSAVYRNQADDEAIRKLLGDAGLTAGTLEATRVKHKELVQYYSTDWDFIVSRAEAQGLAVDAHLGMVSVVPLVSSAQPKVKLEHGLKDVELDLEVDATDQWAELTSQGWDAKNLAVTEPAQAKDPKVKVGNLDAAAVARKLGGASNAMLHPVPLPQDELSAWASARLARSRLTMLRGNASVPGNPDLAPLDVVEVEGVGQRFNGKALVTGVVHRLDLGSWRTELRFGLSPEIFAREADIADAPAAGLLPPVQGIQVGVVAGFEDDPDGEHRLKVKPAALDDQQGPLWARVARPDAGDKRGQVFWPEPNDEVVLGFVNGDPRQPIILGSLYGSKNAPPEAAGPPSEDNNKRAIVSRGGTAIAIDDEKNAITIETPGGNKVTVDDDAGAITLEDQNGNKITLDSSGMTLKVEGDFNVDASGKVVIKGSAVDVQ